MKKKIILLTAAVLIASIGLIGGGLAKDAASADDGADVLLEEYKSDIVPVYPAKSQTVNILKETVRDYIGAMKAVQPENDYYFNDYSIYKYKDGTDIHIDDFFNGGVNLQASKKLALVWENNTNDDISEYKVSISLKQDLSNPIVLTTTDTYATVENLYAGTEYYWQVKSSDGTKSSPVFNFKTEEGYRMLSTNDIMNVRDLGGRMTESGKRVKQGLIYRGGEINSITYVDDSSGGTHHANLDEHSRSVFLDTMGVKVELDFRGDAEANNQTKSNLSDEIDYVRASIPAYTECYKDYARANYATIFRTFLTADQKPVYFHCWGGADRTGTVGFLLNGLLGVSYTDLLIDYELTSFSKNLRAKEDIANDSYPFTMFVEGLQANYGTPSNKISDCVENYLKTFVGLTDDEITQLKTVMLEEVQ